MTLKCLQDWRRYLHVSKMEYFRLPSSWLPSCLLSPSSSKTFFLYLNKSMGSRVYAVTEYEKLMKNEGSKYFRTTLKKICKPKYHKYFTHFKSKQNNPKGRVNFQFSQASWEQGYCRTQDIILIPFNTCNQVFSHSSSSPLCSFNSMIFKVQKAELFPRKLQIILLN